MLEKHVDPLKYAQLIKNSRLAAENKVEEEAKVERRIHLSAVTERLHPPNTLNDHERAVKTRENYLESGRWILHHPLLKDWMDFTSTNVPVLWINGIPGAGILLLQFLAYPD